MKCPAMLVALVIVFAAARPPAAKAPVPAESLLLDLARPTPQPLRMLASTDPKGGNEDYVTIKPKETGEFAKLSGPATIVRLWFTGDPVERMSVSAVVDGKTIPLRKEGKFAGFPKDPKLGGAPDKSYFCYEPMTLRKTFKLTATNHAEKDAKFFYQVGYCLQPRTIEPAPLVAARSRPESASDTGTVSTSVKGRGVIEEVAISLETGDAKAISGMRFRITGANKMLPTVDVSLGALLGGYFERANVESYPISVRATGKKTDIALRLRLPYDGEMTVSVDKAKVGAKLALACASTDSVPPYRFCAKQVALQSVKNKPLDLLDLKGEGNFVGLTFACAGTFQRNFAMLEGDEIIEVDDDPKLRMQGTGTEDTFNSSWYFPDKPFNFPFHGMTHKSTPPAKVSCYRWFITDRIPFKKHFKLQFEHGGRNNTEGVEYQAVLFWYQKP